MSFHPNDSRDVRRVLMNAVVREWAVPTVEPTEDGFRISDSFTGTWDVTITAVASSGWSVTEQGETE